MVKTVGIFSIVLLALYAGICFGEEKKADIRLVQTLMDKAGLNKQLEEIPQLIEAGMAEANEETEALSPEALSEVSSAAASAFDAGRLKETLQKHIEANLPEDDIRAALAWLNSPLGEKVARLEEKTANPQAYADMLNMADELIANAARVELVKKLDNAVKATETAVAAAISTQTSLIAGLTSTMEPGKRPKFEDIENEVKKNLEQTQQIIQAHTLLTFLYSYRELTDDEINQYLKYAESGSGKKYHSVVATGLDQALSGAAHLLGNQIEQSPGRPVHDLKKKKITV